MTGLIYVILIAMWGVVLVPRWLRHHDESRRRRETNRLARALAPQAPEHDELPADDGDGRSQSWGEYLRSLTHVDTSAFVGQMRTPQGRHARRRRTILMGLGGGFGLALIGTLAGVVPGFLVVLLGLSLTGYVSAMFLQMRQWEAQRDRRRMSPSMGAADQSVQRPSATRLVSDGVRVVQGTQAVGSSWEPRETTLPTYVSKSKASKIPRRIDLTRDGWTGAGMVREARQQQASPALQSQFDREFAAIEPDAEADVDGYANPDSADRYYRRAVNE